MAIFLGGKGQGRTLSKDGRLASLVLRDLLLGVLLALLAEGVPDLRNVHLRGYRRRDVQRVQKSAADRAAGAGGCGGGRDRRGGGAHHFAPRERNREITARDNRSTPMMDSLLCGRRDPSVCVHIILVGKYGRTDFYFIRPCVLFFEQSTLRAADHLPDQTTRLLTGSSPASPSLWRPRWTKLSGRSRSSSTM